MADDKVEDSEENKKSGGKGKILILLLAVLSLIGGGAIGYLGVVSLPGGQEKTDTKKDKELADISGTSFIDLPEIIIPLGDNANARHLRARFTLETSPVYMERIKLLSPRIMDMLNTYLRAVDESEISKPERFQRLQAQILRRAKLIAGDTVVRNFLVQEFMLQ